MNRTAPHEHPPEKGISVLLTQPETVVPLIHNVKEAFLNV